MFRSSEHIMWQWPPGPLPTERKWKSNVEIAPKCPRCASSNTKFCYYNNYSLSQPRYFCKGCRRYWTKGGSLRNIPVGGGCRKSRRAMPSRVSHVERCSKSLSGLDTNTNNDQSIGDGDSANLGSIGQPNATDGSETDLAVVFSKFLNQDPPTFEQELPDESKELNNAPNSLTPDGVPSDATIDCQKPADLVFQEPDLLDGLPQSLAGDQQRLQELIETDGVDAMGLQTLLGEEVVEDTLWLWSDTDPAMPNVARQPTLELQEFDPFPVEDQIKSAANLLSDYSWSSFDFSSYEIFSRP